MGILETIVEEINRVLSDRSLENGKYKVED